MKNALTYLGLAPCFALTALNANATTFLIQEAGFDNIYYSRQFYKDGVSEENKQIESIIDESTSKASIYTYSMASAGVLKNGGWLNITSSSDYGTGSYNPNFESLGHMQSTAAWYDNFTVYTPDASQTGKSATINFAIDLRGQAVTSMTPRAAIGGSGGVSASMDLYIYVDGIGAKTWHQESSSDASGATVISGNSPNGSADNVSGIYNFSVPVIIGATQTIQMSLSGYITGATRGGSFASGAYEYSRSIYWGGAQSLDIDGEKIVDFSVLAGSGANLTNSYAPPVPEASTLLMSLSGLFLLLAFKKIGAKAQSVHIN